MQATVGRTTRRGGAGRRRGPESAIEGAGVLAAFYTTLTPERRTQAGDLLTHRHWAVDERVGAVIGIVR